MKTLIISNIEIIKKKLLVTLILRKKEILLQFHWIFKR
jgi:hypothetical protein